MLLYDLYALQKQNFERSLAKIIENNVFHFCFIFKNKVKLTPLMTNKILKPKCSG